MRSIVLCCAVVACAAGMCTAQNLNQVIPPEARAHDFGVVARAANTEHRFELSNPFNSNLHIRSVRASCGCTTPIVETETIPPGGKGSILARFNTGSFTGQRSASLTVTIDSPVFTELQLNVQGYIRSDIVFSPGEVSFGAVPQGEPQSRELVLNYAGRQDWAMTEISSPADFIKVTFAETERATNRVSYKLNVQLTEAAPAGFFQNQLIVKTNDRRLTSVPLKVSVTVEPALQAAPQMLALGNVKPGEPVTQKLVVKGREPFVIQDISCDHAEIRFEKDETAKRAFILNLVITPREQPEAVDAANGDVVSAILIKTSLQDDPLKLPMNFKLERQAGAGGEIAAID